MAPAGLFRHTDKTDYIAITLPLDALGRRKTITGRAPRPASGDWWRQLMPSTVHLLANTLLAGAAAYNNGLGATPQMGWNRYYLLRIAALTGCNAPPALRAGLTASTDSCAHLLPMAYLAAGFAVLNGPHTPYCLLLRAAAGILSAAISTSSLQCVSQMVWCPADSLNSATSMSASSEPAPSAPPSIGSSCGRQHRLNLCPSSS
eukprot:SAG31_NODE_926_length_10930_cov_135.691626_2_plen_204_part_00